MTLLEFMRTAGPFMAPEAVAFAQMRADEIGRAFALNAESSPAYVDMAEWYDAYERWFRHHLEYGGAIYRIDDSMCRDWLDEAEAERKAWVEANL